MVRPTTDMLVTVALFAVSPGVVASSVRPNVHGYNSSWMAEVRDMILSGKVPPDLQPPLAALVRSANGALRLSGRFPSPFCVSFGAYHHIRLISGGGACPEKGPWSVTADPVTPPSGDKHDFSYISTYAWPCNAMCPPTFGAHCAQWWRRPSWVKNTTKYPDWSKCDNATGLPWIGHDGFGQPQGQHDTGCSVQMSDSVSTLAIAYYFSSNETYAKAAAALLNTWFIDPATAMNPSLSFAGYTPGASNGSSSGIIATSLRWNSKVSDAARLLAGSPSWPATSQALLNKWNAEYLDWLLSSKMGQGEGRATNNHFTWYSVQTLALALDVGNSSAATNIVARCTAQSTPGALDHQIRSNGLMPLEAARDASVSYSTMNVVGLFTLATVASYVPGTSPLWTYKAADGTGSMQSALDFLSAFGTNKSNVWPYSQDGKSNWQDMPWTNLAVPLRIASILYNDPSYEQSIVKLPWPAGEADTFVKEDVSRLLWPVMASQEQFDLSTLDP